MDKIICKVCSDSFENDLIFHRHLRKHKLTQTEYYQTHFPRHDRYDGHIIKFKNKEYYFTSEFNNRANLKLWLESAKPFIAELYVRNTLAERRVTKGMVYAPTQIELRSLMLPGMKYIIQNFGDYDKLCTECGLKLRFSQHSLDTTLFTDVSKKFVFTDSREQKALDLDNRTKIKGLSFGDYSMKGSDIYIERKSLSDVWGTLSGGYERFEKEVIRAKEANAYLVVLVESKFNNLERFPYQRQVYGKIKLPVEFIWHNIRKLLQKYQHIQFLFVNDREESSRIISIIYSAGQQVKDVDLQYLYDVGQL